MRKDDERMSDDKKPYVVVYEYDGYSGSIHREFSPIRWNGRDPNRAISLYATPPAREWVGLTDEEVGTLTVFDGLYHVETPILADFIRAIEAALKAKHT